MIVVVSSILLSVNQVHHPSTSHRSGVIKKEVCNNEARRKDEGIALDRGRENVTVYSFILSYYTTNSKVPIKMRLTSVSFFSCLILLEFRVEISSRTSALALVIRWLIRFGGSGLSLSSRDNFSR
jgi:hypothetical protein